MGKAIPSDPIVLNLPADQNLMLVIRLTAAGVIARAGATVDRMDDIKMAVEEACGCLMEQVNPPRRLNLRFTAREGQLYIRAEALEADTEAGDLTSDALEIMRCILLALVDTAEFEVRDGFIAAVDMQAALSL